MSFLCVTRASSGNLLARAQLGALFFQARQQSLLSTRTTDGSSALFRDRTRWVSNSTKRQIVGAAESPRDGASVRYRVIRTGGGCFLPRRYLFSSPSYEIAPATIYPSTRMTNKPKLVMPISTLHKSASYRALHHHRSSENFLDHHDNSAKNKTNHQQSNGFSTSTANNSQHQQQPQQHRQAPTPVGAKPYALASNPNFTTMASVQKLAIEPTREHIENIRKSMQHTNAKDNSDQEVTLRKDSESGIAYMCIKSAAKNGISAKMMCDFLDIIDELYAWPEGKGVLIYGHNGFFCSGGDLVSVREMANYEDGLKMATLMQYNMSRLQSLPMITMALIQGKALGGGAEISVTTDLRVMTKSSKFGYVQCRVGIVAAWGGGSRLVQLVGPSRAVELMASGRQVGADEALSLGLVNSVIDDAGLTDQEVVSAAKSYLESHIGAAKSTIVAIKGLVNAARTLPLEHALVVEGQILSSTWGKPPHLEALNNNVKHRDE